MRREELTDPALRDLQLTRQTRPGIAGDGEPRGQHITAYDNGGKSHALLVVANGRLWARPVHPRPLSVLHHRHNPSAFCASVSVPTTYAATRNQLHRARIATARGRHYTGRPTHSYKLQFLCQAITHMKNDATKHHPDALRGSPIWFSRMLARYRRWTLHPASARRKPARKHLAWEESSPR